MDDNDSTSSKARGDAAAPPVDNVVSLVRSAPDERTVGLFNQLAAAAGNGEIVGAIVIALRPRARPGKPYFVSLTGAAEKNPTYACGALSACHMLVQELALERAGLL